MRFWKTVWISSAVAGALLGLAGCEGEGSEPGLPSCDAPEELGDNSLVATVDGEAWDAPSSGYQLLPTGFQAAFAADAQNTVTIRLLQSSVYSLDELDNVDIDDGDDIDDILAANAQADFNIGDAERHGSDATMVVEGTTVSSSNGSRDGFLRLFAREEDEDTGAPGPLTGCFFFDADTQDRDDPVDIIDGTFSVWEFGAAGR